MTAFLIYSGLLLIFALFLLVPVLLRPNHDDLPTDAALIGSLENELKRLESRLAAGAIDQSSYDKSREKTALALVEAVAARKQAIEKPPEGSKAKWTAIAVSVFVPVLAGFMYMKLGQPDLLQPAPDMHAPAGQQQAASMPELIKQLETRLAADPENAEGWYMLARTHLSSQNYAKAVTALEKVYDLVGDEPAILVQYADALAMTNDGRVSGKPAELVKKALELQPEHPEALWLSGIAASEQGDHETSIRQWNKARQVLSDDASSVAMLDRAIEEAKTLRDGGSPATEQQANDNQQANSSAPQPEPVKTTASDGQPKVTVTVSLSPDMAAKAAPDDTVFIYARAVSGPPMPLAAVRSKVSELPATVVLDDSQAMMPTMKLSAFPEVVVGARISQTGQALPQPGDLEGLSSPLKTAEENTINLIIDQVRS